MSVCLRLAAKLANPLKNGESGQYHVSLSFHVSDHQKGPENITLNGRDRDYALNSVRWPTFNVKNVLIFLNAKLLKKCTWTEQWDRNSGRRNIKESRTNRWKKSLCTHNSIMANSTWDDSHMMGPKSEGRQKWSNCNNGNKRTQTVPAEALHWRPP